MNNLKKKFHNNLHKLKTKTKDKEIILTKVKPRRKVNSQGEYKANGKDRNDAICLAYLSGAYSMKQIGDYFGAHYSTVSRVADFKF